MYKLDIRLNLHFVHLWMVLILAVQVLIVLFSRMKICNSSEDWRFEIRIFRKRKRNISLSQKPLFSKRIRGFDPKEVISYVRQTEDGFLALNKKKNRLIREKSEL